MGIPVFCALIRRDIAQAVRNPAWRSLFDGVFNRVRLIEAFGPDAVNYSMSQEFTDHFHDVFSAALMEYDPHRNYFVHSVFGDGYPPIGQSDTQSHDYLINQFRAVDTNGDGHIDVHELRRACMDAGVPINQQRAGQLIAAVTEQGRVSLDEFLSLMFR